MEKYINFQETMETIGSFEQLMVDILPWAIHKYNRVTCSIYTTKDVCPINMSLQSETEIYYEFIDKYGSNFKIILTKEDF